MASRFSLFLAELKRRNVGRVAAVYAAVGTAIAVAVPDVFATMLIPAWASRLVILVIILGFPVALVLAWALEVTPAGIQRTPDVPPEETKARAPERWSPSLLGFGLAAVFVLAGVGYWVLVRGSRAPAEGNASAETSVNLIENRVAVMPFEDRTGRENLTTLGEVVAEVLAEGLNRFEAVEVVPTSVTIPFAREAGPGSSEILLEGKTWTLGDETRAGTVVRGAYYVLGDSLQIQAEISDERTQTILESMRITWPASDPMGAAGEVRQRVLGPLAMRFDPRLTEDELGLFYDEHLPRYDAFEAHMKASEAAFGRNQSAADLYRYSMQAFELDSTFYLPLVNAAYATMGSDPKLADSLLDIAEAHREELGALGSIMLDIIRSRGDGRLQAEYLASKEWVETVPDFGQGLWQLGWAALHVNRPHEALEVLLEADPDSYSLRWEPGYWTSLADAYHFLGRHDEEWASTQEARKRFPESTTMLTNELEALAALGRVEDVMQGVEELYALTAGSPTANLRTVAEELRAHGHDEAARRVLDRIFAWYDTRPPSELEGTSFKFGIARTHYLAGNWDEAEALFAEIRAGEPTENQTLERYRVLDSPGCLGVIAAFQGNREEAEAYSRELAGIEWPYENGYIDHWRARIAAALGDWEEAMALILEAHARGRRFTRVWHRDRAFESLRDYPPFQEFMRPKG